MAVLPRATLLANANANLADNAAAAIDAADARASVVDLIDSAELGLENLFKLIDVNSVAHTNSNVLQQWFATAGAVTIPLPGVYQIEGTLWLKHGTGSHNTSLLFGGTAPVTWIEYLSLFSTGASLAIITAQSTKWSSAITAQNVSGTVTTAEEIIVLDGLVEFSATGTFIPQFQYSAAPGTTTATGRGTRFALRYLGDTSFVARGTWA